MAYKVLIADNLDSEGVEILRSSGIIETDYRKKTDRAELLAIIGDYDGLIIRSASRVDQELLEHASRLKVVIRAGVGVDNIDIPACSQKGVVVMNAPAGNSVSTAEQAIALMFALARHTPQANESMKARKWEKSRFQGTQLTGKILGVIGLGRIGKEVVVRAQGLGMRVMGHDPFIPEDKLEYLQIRIASVDEILAEADFVTVHTPLTDTTRALVHPGNLSRLKPGIRLINAARGGIYDEQALAEGLRSGVIAGVGLDVFETEPPASDHPLYEFENCIMAPHLGASTDEAQLEVAKETAESMVAFVKSGVARNSLNFPTIDPREMNVLSPWFSLIENVADFGAQALGEAVTSVEIEFSGPITAYNLKPLEIAAAKGLLNLAMGDEVNLVNASILARDRGLNLAAKKNESSTHTLSSVTILIHGAGRTLQLKAAIGASGPAIISINSFHLEFDPQGRILFIRNKDVPRVVGELGGILGESNLNIATLQLARESRGGEVLTVIHVDEEVPREVMDRIRKEPFIVEARYICVTM